MRLTCLAALLVMTAPAAAVGCGGSSDPLGGPYGGTMTNVAPNEVNQSVSVDEDAGGGSSAPAPSGSSTSSSGSSTSSSSSGSTSSSGGRSSSGSSSGRSSSTSSTGSSTSSSGSGNGNTTSSSGTGNGNATSSSGTGNGNATSSSGVDAGSSSPPTGPTWTDIYNNYMKAGTTGNCAAGGCHSFQMPNPKGAYSYLQAYISGPNSALVKTGSCLTWYGGNMPPGGPRSEPMATMDMNAWAAAGAMDN